MSVLRPRKDGCGCSECSSPDELVGKGRCVHVLTNEKPLEIQYKSRGHYVVEVGDQGTLDIKGERELVVSFFKSLPTLEQDKQDEIIRFLEGE